MKRLMAFILAASILTLMVTGLHRGFPLTGGEKTGQALAPSSDGRGILVTTASGLQIASPEAYTYGYDLMARVISGEARGEPYVGQVAVGAVIMNRVRSHLFPNTIPGVIFEPDAFTAVANGEIWSHVPSITAYRAAQDALAGWDPTGGALYYYNPAKATNWWVASRPVTAVIGSHIFTR